MNLSGVPIIVKLLGSGLTEEDRFFGSLGLMEMTSKAVVWAGAGARTEAEFCCSGTDLSLAVTDGVASIKANGRSRVVIIEFHRIVVHYLAVGRQKRMARGAMTTYRR
jgi:hypothetical protein